MQNFENELIKMSKPEVAQLKHQDLLANAIMKSKGRSAISWWWLSIPLYIIATLLMKTIFMPGTTLITNISELRGREKFSSLLFFIILPVIFGVVNFMSIRKIYILSGRPKTLNFFLSVWFNILMILFSIVIVIIYSL